MICPLCSRPLACRASLICQWSRSTIPFDWGWKAVVVMCSTCSSSDQLVHVPHVNCVGGDTLHHAKAGYPAASSTVSAASHLELRSMIVSRYQWPAHGVGRGPTRSTCTWEKRCCRISIFSTSVASWLVTFALWQAVHSLHHSLMSEAKPGQRKWLLTNLVVASVPACERERTCSNTALWCLLGISGLMLSVERSHHTSADWMVTCCS